MFSELAQRDVLEGAEEEQILVEVGAEGGNPTEFSCECGHQIIRFEIFIQVIEVLFEEISQL